MFKLSSTQDFVEKLPAKSATDPAPQSRDSSISAAAAVGDAEQATSVDLQRQLENRIGSDRFDMWFDGEHNFQVGDDSQPTVSVSADSSFTCQRIQKSLGHDIRLIVDRVCGPQFSIEYVVAESCVTRTDAAEGLPGQPAGANRPDVIATPSLFDAVDRNPSESSSGTAGSAGAADSKQPPKQSQRPRGLNGFYFGENNPLIEKAVEQSFRTPGRYSPLFVYGSVGSGKSHLLESYTHDFRKRLRMSRCVYLTAEQFTGYFLHSLRGGTGLPVFRRKYRDLDLLAIDNVQFFAGKRATLNEFQYTIDHLIRSGKQVLLSADRPPMELQDMGSEVATRVAAGLVCSLDYPDFESRRRITRQFCKPLGLDLSDDVVDLVCQTLTRDVRKLSGAVNRLSVLQSLTGSRITTDQVRETLVDLFSVSCLSLIHI